ncbi:MAG: PGPGW domain-containing protein [Mariprofundus sp.]|nr:PGPGW domain-containing protein [Mariprofundus sp.]
MIELWQQILSFLNDYGLWLAIGSLIFFVISLASVPLIVARIPVDYFTLAGHQRQHQRQHHPVLHTLIICAKNLFGFILLTAGIIMLFTPGQGILSILFALMIMNYPGKFKLECSIMRKPLIFNAVNRLRAKQHREALLPPEYPG